MKHMHSRRLVTVFICMVVSILTACATNSGTGGQRGAADVADSDLLSNVLSVIGLQKTSDDKSAGPVPINIFTAGNLNDVSGHKGLSLVLKIYHLQYLSKFQQMTFNDFLDDDKAKQTLGSALLDERQILLQPHGHYSLTDMPPPDTRYIGFVALFLTPAARRWRFAYDAHASAKTGITVGMQACAMTSTRGALQTQLKHAPDSLSDITCPAS